LDEARVTESREKISRYIEKLAAAGEKNAHQLTVYGLAYLKGLHKGRDPRFTGCYLGSAVLAKLQWRCCALDCDRWMIFQNRVTKVFWYSMKTFGGKSTRILSLAGGIDLSASQ